jgi:TonB family protein
LHVISPVAVTLLTLLVLLILSWILHFNFWDLFKPKPQPQDLEFTLVNDTQATRPDKPLFKGNHNQRAGGQQDSKQPLKAVEEPPQTSAASKPQVTPEQPEMTAKPEEQPVQQQMPQPPQPKQPPVQKPKQEAPKLPKPAFLPSIPMPVKAEQTDSKTDGPVAKTQTASAAASHSDSAPQVVSVGSSFSGASASNSSTSNPQKGDADKPGVDVAEDIDFGPFMADLEKRIKRNWVPPRGSESRKVMLLFYLARDGHVIKIETKKSSGDFDADRAAIAAVEASAPFQDFPPQVQEDILPVEFTFDYNVLNPTNPKHALKW